MTERTINVKLKDGHEIKVPYEMRLEDLAKRYGGEKEPLIVAARVNNKLRELTYHMQEDAEVSFVSITSLDGIRIYQRSLSFVFIRAAMELYKNTHVRVEHSLSGGLFCEFDSEEKMTIEDIAKIKKRMEEIVKADEPFYKEAVPKAEAKAIFEKFNMESKIHYSPTGT